MKTSERYKKLTNQQYIYNVCHFDNLSSILNVGILSYSLASKIKHTSIAMPEIQDNRDRKKVPNGLYLHQYANCFFNPRNSMLYSKKNEFDKIAIICVSNEVLDLKDVVVSDKNAATNTVAFYSAEIGIPLLNYSEIFLQSWDHPDQYEKERLKPILHAEVLVPSKIEPRYIMEIRVVSDHVKQELLKIIGNTIKINVDPYLFFKKGGQ